MTKPELNIDQKTLNEADKYFIFIQLKLVFCLP